ncbi:MAG: hypothetical protein ACLFWD_08490 [Anaerolineales bacterium]
MSLNLILPFFSTAVMLVFTIWVLQKFATRRKAHFLFWGLGLAMFGTASFAEAFLALNWNRWVFFSWYLFGAALNAGWIGHGTLYLLVRKKWVHVITGILIVGSVIATWMMLQVMPLLDEGVFTTALPVSEQYAEIMPAVSEGASVRLTTPFFNIYGLITLVGGALYSSFLFWRKRVMPNRVIGNVLIAAGALFIGLASSLTRFGEGSYLYIGELVAAVLMFSGFMLAGKPAADRGKVPATVASESAAD